MGVTFRKGVGTTVEGIARLSHSSRLELLTVSIMPSAPEDQNKNHLTVLKQKQIDDGRG